MSRYYDIALSGIGQLGSGNTGPPSVSAGWSSYPNGVNDPGALQVELDLLQCPFAAPGNGGTVTIHGIALNDLFQAQQFTGMNIVVKGGMQAGLPLANPSQAGIIAQGEIIQSFGNWIGSDMNLNFTINAAQYNLATPGNFVFQWSPGQSLTEALQATLGVAYPSATFTPQLAETYSTPAVLTHAVSTLRQVAQFIKANTKSATSGGVDITILGDGTIVAYDGRLATKPIKIAFTDLVGQPRWVAANVMQFVTVMRADVQVGTFVTMPLGLENAPGIVTSVPGQQNSSWLKYKTAFQGNFIIQQVRHIGNFRSPDGGEWITVFDATPQSVGA